MSIIITKDEQAALDAFLDAPCDWYFDGKPISRRSSYGGMPGVLNAFELGWHARASRAAPTTQSPALQAAAPEITSSTFGTMTIRGDAAKRFLDAMDEPAHDDHPTQHYDRTCPGCNHQPAPTGAVSEPIDERAALRERILALTSANHYESDWARGYAAGVRASASLLSAQPEEEP